MARYYFLEVGDWFSARFDLTPNFISQWRIQTAPPPLMVFFVRIKKTKSGYHLLKPNVTLWDLNINFFASFDTKSPHKRFGDIYFCYIYYINYMYQLLVRVAKGVTILDSTMLGVQGSGS